MKDLGLIHTECADIFKTQLVDSETGVSFACKIYSKMTNGDGSGENCLGENFNQLVYKMVDDWFGNYKPTGNLDFYFFNYILLLYLFVERVDFVFSVLNLNGKNKLFADFQDHNFKCLRKINKWANFVKHPKEFLFTHWPVYFIEGEDVTIGIDSVVVDTDFIFNHYFSEKNPRPAVLENNTKVFVKIPDLIILTKEFCKEINIFFDFICDNKIVADFLRRKSTIEDFYKDNIIIDLTE